jgi:hypothetical protein
MKPKRVRKAKSSLSVLKPNSTTIRTIELAGGNSEVEVQVTDKDCNLLKFDVPSFDLDGKTYRFKRWDDNQKVSVYQSSPAKA